jgi:hypothetical protein
MAHAGVRDIFLSNEVVSAAKIARFVALLDTGAGGRHVAHSNKCDPL